MQKILTFLFLLFQVSSYSQLAQKYFSQKDGLSSYNLRSIVKDNNGFLWITTQDGLNKFDGKNFETFTNDNTDKLTQLDFIDCRTIYLDTLLNQIWVLGDEYGINVIDCNTNCIVNRIKIDVENRNVFFICFFKNQNFIWIGTSMGLYLYNLKTKNCKHFPLTKYTKTELRVNKIEVDVFNNIWIGINNYGAIIIDSKKYEVLKTIPLIFFGFNEKNLTINTLHFNKNLVTISSNVGATTLKFDKKYNITQNVPCPLNQEVGVRGIYKIDGTIYESKDGLFKLEDTLPTLQKVSIQNNVTEDWLKSINTITAVKKNIIALGCNDGLLLINTNPQAIKPTTNNKVFYNNNLSHLYSIEKYNDKELLLATETGLFIIRNDNSLIPINTSSTYYNI